MAVKYSPVHVTQRPPATQPAQAAVPSAHGKTAHSPSNTVGDGGDDAANAPANVATSGPEITATPSHWPARASEPFATSKPSQPGQWPPVLAQGMPAQTDQPQDVQIHRQAGMDHSQPAPPVPSHFAQPGQHAPAFSLGLASSSVKGRRRGERTSKLASRLTERRKAIEKKIAARKEGANEIATRKEGANASGESEVGFAREEGAYETKKGIEGAEDARATERAFRRGQAADVAMNPDATTMAGARGGGGASKGEGEDDDGGLSESLAGSLRACLGRLAEVPDDEATEVR